MVYHGLLFGTGVRADVVALTQVSCLAGKGTGLGRRFSPADPAGTWRRCWTVPASGLLRPQRDHGRQSNRGHSRRHARGQYGRPHSQVQENPEQDWGDGGGDHHRRLSHGPDGPQMEHAVALGPDRPSGRGRQSLGDAQEHQIEDRHPRPVRQSEQPEARGHGQQAQGQGPPGAQAVHHGAGPEQGHEVAGCIACERLAHELHRPALRLGDGHLVEEQGCDHKRSGECGRQNQVEPRISKDLRPGCAGSAASFGSRPDAWRRQGPAGQEDEQRPRRRRQEKPPCQPGSSPAETSHHDHDRGRQGGLGQGKAHLSQGYGFAPLVREEAGRGGHAQMGQEALAAEANEHEAEPQEQPGRGQTHGQAPRGQDGDGQGGDPGEGPPVGQGAEPEKQGRAEHGGPAVEAPVGGVGEAEGLSHLTSHDRYEKRLPEAGHGHRRKGVKGEPGLMPDECRSFDHDGAGVSKSYGSLLHLLLSYVRRNDNTDEKPAHPCAHRNPSELARDLGVALNTVKARLSVLEATFQVTVLRPCRCISP